MDENQLRILKRRRMVLRLRRGQTGRQRSFSRQFHETVGVKFRRRREGLLKWRTKKKKDIVDDEK